MGGRKVQGKAVEALKKLKEQSEYNVNTSIPGTDDSDSFPCAKDIPEDGTNHYHYHSGASPRTL